MNFFFVSASRPMSSCTKARSDQARHQSSHDKMEPVTSSKSLSATPLATKRGAQCAIAEVTRGAEAMEMMSLGEKRNYSVLSLGRYHGRKRRVLQLTISSNARPKI